MGTASAGSGGPPRVVLFRQSSIDRDSRAKKFALTLARAGYDVTLLNPVEDGSATDIQWLGPVRVVPVAVPTTERDRRAALSRRRRQLVRLLAIQRLDARVGRMRAPQGAIRHGARVASRRREQVASSPSVWRRMVALVRWFGARSAVALRRRQLALFRAIRAAHGRLDRWWMRTWERLHRQRVKMTIFATEGGVLPEVLDYATAFEPVLEQLRPDIIHAHNPLVLPAAARVTRRLRAAGQQVQLVYDARENYAGIPEGEQGNPRRHHVLVRQESRWIRNADLVLTVSEPIADELWRRYRLNRRPTVVLNLPVLYPVQAGPTARSVAGVPDGVPMLVYSGGISRARSIELMVDVLGLLPTAHVVLIPVPLPHPMVPELVSRAEGLGVAARLHIVPPTRQDRLSAYLSGADVAVHPLPGGSPNHDQALPNKLFEYMHAGVPMVVSDAKLLASFVDKHKVGAVFRTDDVTDLARAVTDVLRDRARYDGLRALAPQFCWQACERVVIDAYATIAALPGGPHDFPAEFPDMAMTTSTSLLERA